LQGHEGTFECYDVLLDSGNRIAVAENHFFLTESEYWVALQNLKVGMRLQTPKGSIGIAGVAKRMLPYVGKVYNLRVEGSNRYLVGKDAVIARDY
jgi:intein/homing endonuclease